MIGGASLILLPQALFRGFFPLAVDGCDPLGAKRQIRMDENPQAIRFIAQNIVGASADNYARLLFRNLSNQLILDFPKIIGVIGQGATMRKR